MKISIKSLYEVYLETSHFFNKVYPDFVTSRKPDRVEGVPVFTFHSINPEIFGEQLEFLKENNYITINADDLYNYLLGKISIPERAVFLTIDDGRRSVWTHGFPLLKKFGFHAAVFIIAGHTKEKSSEPGVQSHVSEHDNNPDDKDILSWQEILIMKDSGLIDFASHTLYHHRIFTGFKIVDFFGPGSDIRPYSFPALPAGLECNILEKDPSDLFGMPVYINDSLMGGRARFIDDPELRKECMRYYKSINPGFKTQDNKWKNEMFKFSNGYLKKNSISQGFSSMDETGKEIYDNLHISKTILEERLGRTINSLCYPFGIWSPLSIEMSKKAGYLASFCAYIPGRPINRTGDDPYKIVRLKDDYLFRLPGKGRKSLLEIFALKLRRRLKGERVY